MNCFARSCVVVGACLGSPALVGIACAQEAGASREAAFDVSANAGIVSDYRYRGLSLSDRNPAIQGGVDVAHKSGLFVGSWASTIADSGGADVEVDLYGGYAGEVAGTSYSVRFLGYLYPGASGLDYFEISAAASRQIGPANIELQAALIPSQSNFTTDNIYTAVTIDTPLPSTPLTLRLRAGRESNALMKKWDWETGLSYSLGAFTGSLSYVDSDYGGVTEAGRNGNAGVVAALTASF